MKLATLNRYFKKFRKASKKRARSTAPFIGAIITVIAGMTFHPSASAQVEARSVTFAVELGGRASERRALLCEPKGPPPYAAVVFNHGSVVDQHGWPGASQQRYRLDRVCESLANEGYLAFAPIREHSPRGKGFDLYEDQYRLIVSQAIDYIKKQPNVDTSRIALAGFSMGGLVSFKVALERKDLRTVALLAPAFGRGVLAETAKSSDALNAPILILVEKGDDAPILRGVDILEKAIGSRKKPLRLIRYDRGGGHVLFYDVGYWWEDFSGYLKEQLAPR